MSRANLQIVLMLGLVVAVAYYWQLSKDDDPQRQALQLSLASTYLINTRSWTYNEQGVLTDILESSSLEHFPGRHESLLEQPRYYSHDGNDQSWTASADHGRFRHRHSQLQLTDQVSLVNHTNQVTLTSEAMTVNMAKKIAASRVPVTITQGANHTRADGMTANLNDQRIRMKPNVESVYVPATQ